MSDLQVVTGPAAIAAEMTVGPTEPERATTPHAVRWAQREIRERFETQFSAWHWTADSAMAACGRPIMLVSNGPALLPETNDDIRAVTCRGCIARLIGISKTTSVQRVLPSESEPMKDQS